MRVSDDGRDDGRDGREASDDAVRPGGDVAEPTNDPAVDPPNRNDRDRNDPGRNVPDPNNPDRDDNDRNDADRNDPDRNEVVLVGRLSAAPEPRTLPSGDTIVTFRVIVRRVGAPEPASDPPMGWRGRRVSVDTLECTAWQADLRRRVRSWQPGDLVEVAGALRRRFWRSPVGPASRYDVEVAQVRRLRSAGP